MIATVLLQHFKLYWQLFAGPWSVSLFVAIVRALLNLKTDSNSGRFLTEQATVKSPWQFPLQIRTKMPIETVHNLKGDIRISKRRIKS